MFVFSLPLSLPIEDRPALYSNLASGAESGWDFSSRWLAHSGPDTGQLFSINTASTVSVDLSAILCANEASLARLFNITGVVCTSIAHTCLHNIQHSFIIILF